MPQNIPGDSIQVNSTPFNPALSLNKWTSVWCPLGRLECMSVVVTVLYSVLYCTLYSFFFFHAVVEENTAQKQYSRAVIIVGAMPASFCGTASLVLSLHSHRSTSLKSLLELHVIAVLSSALCPLLFIHLVDKEVARKK